MYGHTKNKVKKIVSFVKKYCYKFYFILKNRLEVRPGLLFMLVRSNELFLAARL